jgi:hypothetical protein
VQLVFEVTGLSDVLPFRWELQRPPPAMRKGSSIRT